MAYANLEQSKRLLNIAVCDGLYDQVSVFEQHKHAIKDQLVGSNPRVHFYRTPESSSDNLESKIYNMPYLLAADGSPWIEANAYFVELVRYNSSPMSRPTDDVRRKASRVLDYKLFCERNKIDWLDFSGRRPSTRPTYKYFRYLIINGERSSGVLNQYTSVVYDFYKYVSKHWHPIDLDRVDTVKTIKILLEGASGNFLKDVEVRTLRKPTGGVTEVPIGYVREHGEDLRPLSNEQKNELVKTINGDEWSAQERLIIQSALYTGARKQSVLTLRMKHLAYFNEKDLNNDGTYTVHAGSGTGIDTKFDKRQQLHFPRQLAEELIIWARSPSAQKRRNKLREIFHKKYPDLEVMNDDDMYIFLSDQGNCYYLAKDDPRFPMIKSRATGQVTDTLKRKLFKFVVDGFPKDFTFHWLRATYAYMYYLWLQPLIESGHIKIGEEISFIQKRLHHKNRETTENYLKLFNDINERQHAQNLYEDNLLDRKMFDLEDREC